MRLPDSFPSNKGISVLRTDKQASRLFYQRGNNSTVIQRSFSLTKVAFRPEGLKGFIIAICFLFTTVGGAMAFNEPEQLELRGFANFGKTFYANPSGNAFYQNKAEDDTTASIRLMALGKNFEIHIAEGFLSTSRNIAVPSVANTSTTERSSRFEWNTQNSAHQQSRFAVDRLNLRLTAGNTDIILGRQAASLATVFYFTPNDFFAPFSADTFFRVYKPGVDAARADIRLGAFSSLTLLAVAGYETDAGTATGWSGKLSGKRTSYIARMTNLLDNTELSLLIGRVRETSIFGWGVQGEIGATGLRVEGHYADPSSAGVASYTEATISAEHRFDNSVTVTGELFHHGSGNTNTAGYLTPTATADYLPYLGKNYFALGAAYEFTPLFTGQILCQKNLTDGSALMSLYGVYSISDEGEVAFGGSLPVMGEKPSGFQLKSEYGSYPSSLYAELRFWF